jgi:hypothetical protein
MDYWSVPTVTVLEAAFTTMRRAGNSTSASQMSDTYFSVGLVGEVVVVARYLWPRGQPCSPRPTTGPGETWCRVTRDLLVADVDAGSDLANAI